ncbi:hypothetical protein K0M31_000403 [Melipona bicolor]|uniref:Uncharacterized protein n=1 Tax=Melipona bicolor TaxID=60889 RepID=A0AA40KWP7_9HYME|nr:hypothetical protein K0M31_000403 [Melipona bicolor]
MDSSGGEDVFNAAGVACFDLVGIRAHRDRKLIGTPPLDGVGTNTNVDVAFYYKRFRKKLAKSERYELSLNKNHWKGETNKFVTSENCIRFVKSILFRRQGVETSRRHKSYAVAKQRNVADQKSTLWTGLRLNRVIDQNDGTSRIERVRMVSKDSNCVVV